MRLSEQTLTQKAIAVVIFLNLLWIQRCKTTSPDGFQTANNTPTRRSHARRHSKSDHSDRYRYVLTSSGVSEKPMTNAHNHDFVLKCPYADLKKAPSSSLEVTWTHNNQQQVTVTHGVPYINPRLPISSIKSKIYKNRTILQVGIDDDHREFHYNEHKERFTFQITRIHSTDLGLWECRIVIDDKGKKKTYTSRKQAKAITNPKPPQHTATTPSADSKTDGPTILFGRSQGGSIEINRQTTSRETIIFSRQDADLRDDRENATGKRILIDRSSEGRKRNQHIRRFGVTDRIQRFIKFVLEARGSTSTFGLSCPLLVIVLALQII